MEAACRHTLGNYCQGIKPFYPSLPFLEVSSDKIGVPVKSFYWEKYIHEIGVPVKSFDWEIYIHDEYIFPSQRILLATVVDG